MDRDQHIQHLKELHAEGGLSAIQPLVQEALDTGEPVHEIEYHECSRAGCATLVETAVQMCDTCRNYMYNGVRGDRKRSRRPR